jgi:phage tail-like protein
MSLLDDSQVSSLAASGGRERPSVRVSVVPDVLSVPARVDLTEGGPGTRLLSTPYHNARVLPSVLVVLRGADRPRLLRLSVRHTPPLLPDSAHPSLHWNKEWYRWMWVRRVPRELSGGTGLTSQDVLGENDRVLTLLLMPGEERQAYLEFDIALTDGLLAGDRPYEIVVEDAENAETSPPPTPAVLRVVHPPSPSLGFLPSVYREALSDEATRTDATGDALRPLLTGRNAPAYAPYTEPPFFARYLRGFDDLIEPLSEAVSRLSLLFAADSTPEEFLPWLSTWIGAVADETWPVLRRRRLLTEAVELFRWRGTRKGLSRYLELYAGVVPRIDDQPVQGMRLGGRGNRLGSQHARLGDVAPHTFVVTLALPVGTIDREAKEQAIHRIIESQKPAHTTYTLRLLSTSL